MPGGVGGGERHHLSSSISNYLCRAVASFRRLLLLRGFHSITRQIQLQDHAVVDQTIDRRRGRHRVFEDSLPIVFSRLLSGARRAAQRRERADLFWLCHARLLQAHGNHYHRPDMPLHTGKQ